MAAAIIPIASAVISAIPILTPVIQDVIKAIQGLFPKDNGDGSTNKVKQETAVSMVEAAAVPLATAGTIQGVPDKLSLATMIETIYQQMKAAGVLGGSASTPTPPILPGAQVLTGATVIILKSI